MTDKIQDFRDLRVWKAAMDAVVQAYGLTKLFPAYETYGLSAQLRRAIVSVPSNIAEGFRRESTKEYLQHLSIAQASLGEAETQIELAMRLGYVNTAEMQELLKACSSIGKQLFALRNALQAKLNPRLPTPDS